MTVCITVNSGLFNTDIKNAIAGNLCSLSGSHRLAQWINSDVKLSLVR
jgi:hypothetical protein